MLVAFSFTPRPGKEAGLRALLDDPETGRRMALKMGATRNILFFHPDGRAIRVLEFPDGVEPVPMGRLAQEDPDVKAFLDRFSEVVEGPMDPDDAAAMRAFDAHIRFAPAFDVRI